MDSLDINSRFINIPLEEIIGTGTSDLFKSNDIVDGLKKSEFKNVHSLATKELYYIYDNNMLYTETEGVTVEFAIESSLANAFLAYYEQIWLHSCPF